MQLVDSNLSNWAQCNRHFGLEFGVGDSEDIQTRRVLFFQAVVCKIFSSFTSWNHIYIIQVSNGLLEQQGSHPSLTPPSQNFSSDFRPTNLMHILSII